MMNQKKPYQKKPGQKREGPKQAKDPERVYSYGVWRLSKYGEISEKKLREKMTRITDNQEWIDSAINKLIDQGYQSDSRYAEMIVRKGLGSKAWGKRRIEQEMKVKGISSDVIEEALEVLNEDDPLERAKDALAKKFRGREIKDQKEWARAMRFLARQGFGGASDAIKLHNSELAEED